MDKVHQWLKGVNEWTQYHEDAIGVWKWNYDRTFFWQHLATYRSRTYNHLVQDRVMTFHDWIGSNTTAIASRRIIDLTGWNRSSVAMITAHWIAYEGYELHIKTHGKQPVDLAAYIEGCLDTDVMDLRFHIINKEY